MAEVRTRFAPSPTGFLHIGGVRTALFAWLVARQNNGKFILRIEDTDQSRQVEGATDHIQTTLAWLGLNPDEGPYFQSQRLEVYQKWAKKLVDDGRAYGDPFSAKEVQTFRDMAVDNNQPFRFRDFRPKDASGWDGKMPLRLKSEPKDYIWHDEVMGDLSAGANAVDDIVLIKSDGFPTYNFAHIVDDAELRITHIIRGQEFVASTPSYLNLYEALDIELPIFASVPHIMAPNGNKKLSKRDGAKDVLDYQKEGYLPEALVSFLATLGWNDGTDQEIFTINELIEKFALSHVGKSGAVFDERRLLWLSGNVIRNTDLDRLCQYAEGYWPESAKNAEAGYKQKVLSLVQERLKHFSELPVLSDFFFEDLPFDPSLIKSHKQLKKMDVNELVVLLEVARVRLAESSFTAGDLTDKLNALLTETQQKPAVLFSLIRIATTNAPASPALADTLSLLGKEACMRRIDQALKDLSGLVKLSLLI